jgi:uncharacterized membrane protein YgaE (UPF0421/DUF939 family)
MPNAVRRAWERLLTFAWPVVQAAAAAGLAWLLARTLLDQPQAVFAPFVAIVVLLGGRGGRARRALQVVAGVAAPAPSGPR